MFFSTFACLSFIYTDPMHREKDNSWYNRFNLHRFFFTIIFFCVYLALLYVISVTLWFWNVFCFCCWYSCFSMLLVPLWSLYGGHLRSLRFIRISTLFLARPIILSGGVQVLLSIRLPLWMQLGFSLSSFVYWS